VLDEINTGICANGRCVRRITRNGKLREQNLNYNTIKIVSNIRSVKYKTKIISDPWSIHCARSRYTYIRNHFRMHSTLSSRVPSFDFVKRTLLISWHRVSRRRSDQSGWTQFPARCNALIQCRGGRVVPGSRHNSRRYSMSRGCTRIRNSHVCECTAARDIITGTATSAARRGVWMSSRRSRVGDNIRFSRTNKT